MVKYVTSLVTLVIETFFLILVVESIKILYLKLLTVHPGKTYNALHTANYNSSKYIKLATYYIYNGISIVKGFLCRYIYGNDFFMKKIYIQL